MRKLNLTFCFIFLLVNGIISQNRISDLQKALCEMDTGNFKGTVLNHSLVQEFLKEFIIEATKREVNLKPEIEKINWIIIEPESNGLYELTGFELSKMDKERKMILLSRACLLDRHILKATLFRELSHYFGLPYNVECCEIMRVKKPVGYSYAWFDDYEIREVVYADLFGELKKIYKK